MQKSPQPHHDKLDGVWGIGSLQRLSQTHGTPSSHLPPLGLPQPPRRKNKNKHIATVVCPINYGQNLLYTHPQSSSLAESLLMPMPLVPSTRETAMAEWVQSRNTISWWRSWGLAHKSIAYSQHLSDEVSTNQAETHRNTRFSTSLFVERGDLFETCGEFLDCLGVPILAKLRCFFG